ncbi:MAG: AraC family transcriptional regulator [Erysipelotrichaceae bacterium]
MSNNRITINDNEKIETSAKLKYVTYSKYEDDWYSLKHFHPFTEIFYVISGKGSFTINNDTFKVQENDMVFVSPQTFHCEKSEKESPLEYVVLGVDNLTITLDDKVNEFIYQSLTNIKDDINNYIQIMLDESNNKHEGYEQICQNILKIILIKSVREMKLHLSSNPTKTNIKKEIKEIIDYINKNYDQEITLDILSNNFNINKYYLVHEFKKYTKNSPINYLINRRIEECKTLLTTTSLSIIEISETLGFSSPSYFSQTFKKATNQSPYQYRISNLNIKQNIKTVNHEFVIPD